MTLRTHNIGYWYTNNPDDYLLKDVNLTFEKGKVYSILSQSGSGKTPFLMFYHIYFFNFFFFFFLPVFFDFLVCCKAPIASS